MYVDWQHFRECQGEHALLWESFQTISVSFYFRGIECQGGPSDRRKISSNILNLERSLLRHHDIVRSQTGATLDLIIGLN